MSGPDLQMAASCMAMAAICLCLTRWPRLWITLSVSRRWAEEEYDEVKLVRMTKFCTCLFLAGAVFNLLLGG